MNKKLISIFLIIIFSLTAFMSQAQDDEAIPVDKKLKKELVDSITSKYYDWGAISMSGKLSSPMLPVTTSVKVYMEKDELTVITISAPLVGEAARIEIDKKEALIVNKMKNTYTTVAMADIEQACPGGLQAIQNMLLGRISLLGSGQLSAKDVKNIEIYDSYPDIWMLVPNQDFTNAPYVYMYNVSRASLQLDRFLLISQNENGVMDCKYIWEKKNMSVAMQAELNGQTMSGTLKLNTPDASAKKIARFEKTSKYRETTLRGVMQF